MDKLIGSAIHDMPIKFYPFALGELVQDKTLSDSSIIKVNVYLQFHLAEKDVTASWNEGWLSTHEKISFLIIKENPDKVILTGMSNSCFTYSSNHGEREKYRQLIGDMGVILTEKFLNVIGWYFMQEEIPLNALEIFTDSLKYSVEYLVWPKRMEVFEGRERGKRFFSICGACVGLGASNAGVRFEIPLSVDLKIFDSGRIMVEIHPPAGRRSSGKRGIINFCTQGNLEEVEKLGKRYEACELKKNILVIKIAEVRKMVADLGIFGFIRRSPDLRKSYRGKKEG